MLISSAQTDRRRAGDKGEQLAAQHLEVLGYRVLERNFSCRQGELDLVAEKGELLCFVEVRLRSSAEYGGPADTISREKQRKVVKAAQFYLYIHKIVDRPLRFDVISIVGRGATAEVEHLPGAFDAGM